MYINGADNNSYLYQSYAASVSSTQKPSAGDLFSKIDTSGDDKVDQTELDALISDINEKTGSSISVDEQFADFDADEDGLYSSEELKSFMDANRPSDEEMSAMQEMNGAPSGPPPGPPPSGGASEEDEEESTYEELLALLEEAEEESSSNSYVALLQSLQSSLYDDESDDEETTDSAYSYLNNLQETGVTGDYSSLSIES